MEDYKDCFYCKHGSQRACVLTRYLCSKYILPIYPPTSSNKCFKDHLNYGMPKKDSEQSKIIGFDLVFPKKCLKVILKFTYGQL